MPSLDQRHSIIQHNKDSSSRKVRTSILLTFASVTRASIMEAEQIVSSADCQMGHRCVALGQNPEFFNSTPEYVILGSKSVSMASMARKPSEFPLRFILRISSNISTSAFLSDIILLSTYPLPQLSQGDCDQSPESSPSVIKVFNQVVSKIR